MLAEPSWDAPQISKIFFDLFKNSKSENTSLSLLKK